MPEVSPYPTPMNDHLLAFNRRHQPGGVRTLWCGTCIPSARPESLLERLERGTAEAERAAGIVRLPAHLVYPLPYEIRSQMRPELLKWGD